MGRRPQSPRLTWLAVAPAAGICSIFGSVGADAHWLAAMGRTIVAQGAIPTGIPYAAAPSADWVNVPVVGELVFHAFQALGGDKALMVFQLLAAIAALTLLVLGMRARGASDASRAAVLLTVFFAALPSFVILRAQIFSLVLFCALLLLLRSEASRPSPDLAARSPHRSLGEPARRCSGRARGLGRLSRVRALPSAAGNQRRPRSSPGGALFLTPALAHSVDYYLGVLRSEAAVRGLSSA